MRAEAKESVGPVEGAVASDHVHMCLRIAPKLAVSKAVGRLKGKSALVLFDRHPERGKRTGRDRTFWARGYFAGTVGLTRPS